MKNKDKTKKMSFSLGEIKLIRRKFSKEISLVPDVKAQMVKALKLRNIILFVCILVSSVAAGVVLILSLAAGGQRLAISNQDERLSMMSKKINEYRGFSDLVTIQGQLENIDKTNSEKKVLSRIFQILSTMLYQGKDKITVSELTVNLVNNTLSFDAQADAGEAPLIDYRVLEAFKKKIRLMRYDHGRYKDENGKEIPSRCMVEMDDEQKPLMDERGEVYAIWQKGKKGCYPSLKKDMKDGQGEKENKSQEFEKVKIYRVPRFNEWHKNRQMDLSGKISGVPHFNSMCIKYSGKMEKHEIKWAAKNDCVMSKNGVEVRDSSNGRNASGNLVLRFSASIALDKNVFAFKNKHVTVYLPTEQNVTDSYVQIKSIFEQRAADCRVGDKDCANVKGEKNGREK